MYNLQEIFSSLITPRSFIGISLFISKLFSVIVVSFSGVLSRARYLWKSIKFFVSCVQGKLVETGPFITTLQFLVTLPNQNIYILIS